MPFILIATFTMLNLFIAVVVNAMQSTYHELEAEHAEAAHAERVGIRVEDVPARLSDNEIAGAAADDHGVAGGIDLSLPINADIDADLLVNEVDFAREPQVVTFDTHGRSIRLLNNHLKSKFVRNGEQRFNAGGEQRLGFFADALVARRRISAEAFRIREYLDAVFSADPNANVIVTGDLNDGEGADFFEREFLTHSVVDRVFGSISLRNMLRYSIGQGFSSPRFSPCTTLCF